MVKTIHSHTEGDLYGERVVIDTTVHQPGGNTAISPAGATLQVDLTWDASDPDTNHFAITTWGINGGALPDFIGIMSTVLGSLSIVGGSEN